MNPLLERLQAYPFERLAALLRGVEPPHALRPIPMQIGEPRHPAPAFVLEALQRHLDGYSRYPKTLGEPELREAIVHWLQQRYALAPGTVSADAHVIPVNGSREALFSFTQCAIGRDGAGMPRVAMPNPCYQIYEGAALLAGAEPLYLPQRRDRPGVPDFAAVEAADWSRCRMLLLCSPDNPTGAVLELEDWREVFALAARHDFIVASDECYSELYLDEQHPPVGVLQACQALGIEGFRNCIAFHSLSKRSSLPGLRSGFVAGDAALIRAFLLYRTYHGSAMPPPHQYASAAAWADERHVHQNRALYREKFHAVAGVLGGALELRLPAGGFYLWPRVGGDEREFARELFRATGVTTMPGRFLSRTQPGGDPGEGRVRIALVGAMDECLEAATRIRDFLRGRG